MSCVHVRAFRLPLSRGARSLVGMSEFCDRDSGVHLIDDVGERSRPLALERQACRIAVSTTREHDACRAGTDLAIKLLAPCIGRASLVAIEQLERRQAIERKAVAHRPGVT